MTTNQTNERHPLSDKTDNNNNKDINNSNKRLKTMTVAENYINNAHTPPSTPSYLPVTSPHNSKIIGQVALSTSIDVETAVTAASAAFPAWSSRTIKSRASILQKFHALVNTHALELAELIVLENGKNISEAFADVAKGNETVEYACSLPQLAQGKTLQVSSGGVYCEDRRIPLGVVASIVPFNFPLMVPMWTVPIALVMGNCVILKPSEKVPLTMRRVAELMAEAGLPPGVFGMIQGRKEVVDALVKHDLVTAVSFVGSTPIAKYVYDLSQQYGKRCVALGGAKNHLVALGDADVELTSTDVVASFAGCAGQRCMAASVLLTIGDLGEVVDAIVDKAAKIIPGQEAGRVGPVIDKTSYDKIVRYITQAQEKHGAQILLDGRKWSSGKIEGCIEGGYWIGPTIIKHSISTDPAMREEIFGPVLSIYSCKSYTEAIQIENSSPFGNAASVYTTKGGDADWFLTRFKAAMLGVNIGIPVPREPFSFGGYCGSHSKYGTGDITGDAGMDFFCQRIKITSKWPKVQEVSIVENGNGEKKEVDHANFAGQL